MKTFGAPLALVYLCSFSPFVPYPIKKKLHKFSHNEIVVCKCLQFRHGLKFCRLVKD